MTLKLLNYLLPGYCSKFTDNTRKKNKNIDTFYLPWKTKRALAQDSKFVV